MESGKKVVVQIAMPAPGDGCEGQSILEKAEEAVYAIEYGTGSDRERIYWNFLRRLYKYIVRVHQCGKLTCAHREVLSAIQPTIEKYGVMSGVVIPPELHSSSTQTGSTVSGN